jgi:hypothetical protein
MVVITEAISPGEYLACGKRDFALIQPNPIENGGRQSFVGAVSGWMGREGIWGFFYNSFLILTSREKDSQ